MQEEEVQEDQEVQAVPENSQVVIIETRSPVETEGVGAEIAKRLVPGDVVLLRGEIGTGKTTLVRGAARALGVEAAVTSPTFTIANFYEGPSPVAHLDLYRLSGGVGIEDEGLFDRYLDPANIVFLEWPELIGAERFVEPTLTISLEHAQRDSRKIEIIEQ